MKVSVKGLLLARRPTFRTIMLFAILSTAAHAQWIKYRTSGTPLTPDGKPDLAAPVPRLLDGKPDLSGVWMHEKTSLAEMKRLLGPIADEADATAGIGMELATIHKYAFNILMDFKPEDAPILPAALEKMRLNQAVASGGAPGCGPGPGFAPPFPLVGLLAEPIKIVQAPRLTMVLYEAGNLYRQLYTDGRSLPKEFDLPAFNGYSAGRWEGNTLVMETAGFNDKTILDVMGHPHSEALRITERFRRRDFGHLDYEITFEDPKMYSKPFTVKIPHDLLADSDIFEMYGENEKDCAHLGKR